MTRSERVAVRRDIRRREAASRQHHLGTIPERIDSMADTTEIDAPSCALFEGLKSGPCVVCGCDYEDHLPPRTRVTPPGDDHE